MAADGSSREKRCQSEDRFFFVIKNTFPFVRGCKTAGFTPTLLKSRLRPLQIRASLPGLPLGEAFGKAGGFLRIITQRDKSL